MREVRFEVSHPQGQFVHADQNRTLFSGGYGAGKTWALLLRKMRLSGLYPHVAHLIAGPTYKALRKDVWNPLLEILRRVGITWYQNRSDYHIRPAWCTNESAGIWLAGADDPDSLKGPNYATVGINEPGIIPEESYKVLLSRARVAIFACEECGVAWQHDASALGLKGAQKPVPRDAYQVDLPCTECGSDWVECRPNHVSLAGTPEGYNWLYDEWVDRSKHPDRDWSEWLHVEAPTSTNKWLPSWYVEDLLDSFDAQLAQEKVFGRFVNVRSGSIYYAFDRAVHLDHRVAYDKTVPLCLTWDFNVSPLCTVVAQQVGDELLVIDEIVSPHDGWTGEVMHEFCDRYGDHETGIIVYGDATGRRRQTQKKGVGGDHAVIKAVARERQLKRFSMNFARSNPVAKDRYAHVNGLLRNARGVSRLRVHPTQAPRVVSDLEKQIYKPGTRIADDQKGKIGHSADALGYLIVARFPIRDRRPRGVRVA